MGTLSYLNARRWLTQGTYQFRPAGDILMLEDGLLKEPTSSVQFEVCAGWADGDRQTGDVLGVHVRRCYRVDDGGR